MANNALDKKIIAKKPIIKKAIKGAMGKIHSATSTALSYMPGMGRMSAEKTGRKVKSLRKLVKEARDYNGAPNRNDDGSFTDAYKTRFMKKAMVDDYMKKVKKGKNS